MAKQSQSKKPITQANKAEIKMRRYLIALPLIAFVIKLITMANIEGGIWAGADAENYLKGVDGLYAEGLFSEASILNYWPAGYPILLWILALISTANFFYLIGFAQSIFFAYATYFLTKNIAKTNVAWLAISTSLIISFNPTLSLSSLAIGYEAPVAACFMMLLGVIIASRLNPTKPQYLYAIYAGAWITLSAFMQPRYLLSGFFVVFLWALTFASKNFAIKLALLASVVALISPAVLVARNAVAIDKPIISTNFAVAINYGAGEQATGGYARVGDFVPCPPRPPATVVSDNQTIACVLKWYLENPLKTVKLSLNKSEFFWSPWSGPLANGTMARNPWLKIAPTQNIAKSESGARLVAGPIGKFVSWLWIIGQIGLLFYGFLALRRGDQTSKLIANVALSSVVVSWLISVGTIGDHRFRVPTMCLSLLLQVAGMLQIKWKLSKAL
jgi:hypothetical protein